MESPDKYIRKAVNEAIEDATGVKVYDRVVPIDESPLPNLYIVVGDQTRSRTAVSKQNYEWLGTIVITLVKINEKGYISTVELDDLDGEVCTVMDALTVPGHRVINSEFITSNTMQIEGFTNTIGQKSIIYELWVNRIV